MSRTQGNYPPTTPCLQHPADWFDPTRRTFTRQQCLKCAVRRDCCQTALRSRPSYGMWAGVWINGDFENKRPLLLTHAHPATEDAKPAEQPTIAQATTPAHRPHRSNRRSRVGKLLIAPPPPLIAAQITARASGNCEIMAPACTYQQAAIFSRRRRATRARQLGSPADGIAACPNCIDLIEHTDIPTALDLGYIVDPRSATSTTAMLWRQHRWVYLDTRGRIHAATDPSLTYTAC
uniref:Transcriptional regulator WhiB n=1 Tax=Mycobacterium riyadhense TaxID=486698 RepID=A0A653F6U0_9MYCO|nr:Transcriptional regulator WhiB [Mycobacterium riyadhense]